LTWSRRRRWIAASAGILVAVAVTVVIERLTLSARVLRSIETAIAERYGVEVRADDLTLSVLDGTAALECVRISEGGKVVFEAERVEAGMRVRDAIDGRYDLARLVLVRPVLRVVVEADGRTNVRRILARPANPPESGRRGVAVLRDATAQGGRIEFDDAVTDPAAPMHAVLRDVRVSVAEMQLSGDPVTESACDFRADCVLEQPGFPARVSVVAWGSRPGAASSLSLHAAITGLDLRQVPHYASAAQRAAIGGDLIHLVADIQARDGVIEPGAVVGEVPGAGVVLPLRVGGTTSEPLFDIESPLGTLLQFPLARVGRFGTVAFGAGWSAVKSGAGAASDIGSGGAQAGEALGEGFGTAGGDVIAGDPLGALGAAGGGVVGAATSLGGGFVAGAKRLLGLGADDPPAGADAALLDREFAEVHARRRLAMLRAARASVSRDDPAARRRRIDAEIGPSSSPHGAGADAK
jgi:hypothetical protein